MSRHKLRPRVFLFTMLCVVSCVYFWLMVTVFEPSPVNVHVDHLRHLRYVRNIAPCGAEDDNVHMLVLVGSHPNHVAVRDVIRHTWGNPGIPERRFKLVFLFGMLADKEQNAMLLAESVKYGDIVQGDFVDSYYNVTIRDLMGFQWAWQFCRKAKYIMRADDDIALDIYRLLAILEDRFSKAISANSIGCYEIVEKAVPRRYGRYAVSPVDYDGHFYANYCMGWMYVLTPAVAIKLVEMARWTKPIWINDVHITGTLASSVGLQLFNLGMKYTLEYKDMVEFLQRRTVTFDMGPTRGDANFTSDIQRIYRENALKSRRWSPH